MRSKRRRPNPQAGDVAVLVLYSVTMTLGLPLAGIGFALYIWPYLDPLFR